MISSLQADAFVESSTTAPLVVRKAAMRDIPLILARRPEGPCAATELADAVGMEQSACSHQLRLLRNLGLVTGERRGRSVIYALYDNHVAELLEQALYHVEHLRPVFHLLTRHGQGFGIVAG